MRDSRFDFPEDKTFRKVAGAAIAVWVVSALVSLGVAVAVIWGIVQLVQYFTA